MADSLTPTTTMINRVIANQALEHGYQLTSYECLAIIMNFSKADEDALDDVQIDSLINVSCSCCMHARTYG